MSSKYKCTNYNCLCSTCSASCFGQCLACNGGKVLVGDCKMYSNKITTKNTIDDGVMPEHAKLGYDPRYVRGSDSPISKGVTISVKMDPNSSDEVYQSIVDRILEKYPTASLIDPIKNALPEKDTPKSSTVEWTDDVVYEMYKSYDLKSLPVGILCQMRNYIDSIIKSKKCINNESM